MGRGAAAAQWCQHCGSAAGGFSCTSVLLAQKQWVCQACKSLLSVLVLWVHTFASGSASCLTCSCPNRHPHTEEHVSGYICAHLKLLLVLLLRL
jgi:hypothetical protein